MQSQGCQAGIVLRIVSGDFSEAQMDLKYLPQTVDS